jgi:two-component system, chemotaxis family, chemotaxis protein CheY
VNTLNRILVVDDAATVRMYHRKILGDVGWQTDEASNGVEALERIHAQTSDSAFDLYVVDINMPRMDGYSFVRELRKLGTRHQAPVLMVSTEAKSADANCASEAGANSYLVKPSRPNDLVLSAALLLGDHTAAGRAARQAAEQATKQPSQPGVGVPS